MKIDQILIRPASDQWIVQFSDDAGNSNNLTLSATGNSTIATLVADATSRLPSPANHPDKAEIQQEIENLEERVRVLKQSIGVV